jgi:hypothetical protein
MRAESGFLLAGKSPHYKSLESRFIRNKYGLRRIKYADILGY